MYISLHLLHSLLWTTFFELQLKSICILNSVSGFLKVKDFAFIIISHILHRLLLHLITICVVFSSNVEEVSILLLISVVFSISFILSLF